MNAKVKHIVLANAIYPPDRGASGKAVQQLAEHLKQSGFRITIIATDQNYQKGEIQNEPDHHIIRVQSRAKRSSYWLRLYTSFLDSVAILRKCNEVVADAYILCTDPPLMSALAHRYLKNKKYLFWTMDLYPEAFVSKGLVSDKNYILKLYTRSVQKNEPVGWISLGPKQKTFLINKYDWKGKNNFIIPCGVHGLGSSEVSNTRLKKDVTLAYCGNLGEAHSSDFILELIQKSDLHLHRFMLSVFGPKAELLKKQIGDRANVMITDWIDEKEMGKIDIQIVSLKNEWTHVCVPSKAMSAIGYHTPLLMHGNKKSDVFSYFEKAIWFIADDPSVSTQIDQFYASLQKEEILIKKEEAKKAAKDIEQQYRKGIRELIKYLSL